jgi:predicted RNA-binding protein
VRRRTKGKKTATRVDLDQNSQLLEEITEESVSTEDIFGKEVQVAKQNEIY